MIIGIDGNEANINVRVGVGQFAYNLLLELYRQNKDDQYYIYLKNPPLNDLPPQSKSWHYLVFGPKFLWTKIALPLRLLFFPNHLDIFYSPSHYSPITLGIPTIPTIHDIGYLNYQDQFTKKDLYQLINWTKSSIKAAKHIVAVSEFTKNEIINTYQIQKDKISIIFNGVGTPPKFTAKFSKEVLSKFKINHLYFLAIGTLKPNKNYPFLIQAFATFLKNYSSNTLNYQLVIAGKKGWLFDEIDIIVKKLKLSNQVIFTDYISEIEKWALYQNAISLVIPSTYEGFGIPAIESQKMGTPVIASLIPPLKEVLKNSALYIDPTDTSTLTNAFQKILDKNYRQTLIKLGHIQSEKYTWENSAKKLSLLFHQILESKKV